MADGKASLNLELLIKLLKLTTSSNDSEALLSARKANEVLAKFGGDWEALLRGKVTVIADPFSASPTPDYVPRHTAPPPPPRPPAPPPPPQAPRARPQSKAHSAPRRAWNPPPPQPTPAPTRNTLRKQRVSLDDLA